MSPERMESVKEHGGKITIAVLIAVLSVVLGFALNNLSASGDSRDAAIEKLAKEMSRNDEILHTRITTVSETAFEQREKIREASAKTCSRVDKLETSVNVNTEHITREIIHMGNKLDQLNENIEDIKIMVYEGIRESNNNEEIRKRFGRRNE